MIKEGKEIEIKLERDAMLKLNHNGIIKLFNTFNDEENIYFLLEYAPNGSLSDLLKVMQILPLPLAKQFTAEIVNALEYMHSKGIAHRDLKPENILLTEDCHLKLGDFGTAKFMDETKKHKESAFVGTPQYVSPEVLLEQAAGPSCDLWALGCILYQFCVGVLPFTNRTEYLILDAIANGRYEFPKGVNADVMDLCKNLLIVDPDKRLGSGTKGSSLSYEALKQHKFFEGINFDEVLETKPEISTEILTKLQIERKALGGDEFDSADEEFGTEKASKAPVTEPSALIKEGIILKKCGWLFYKKRKLRLTSRPRLSYYEPDKGEYKGDVTITNKTKAVGVTSTKFQVMTVKRTYYFEGLTPIDTDQWVELINIVIEHYYPNKSS